MASSELPPKTLDHYKCYQVLDGKEINKTVSLDDQFDRQQSVRVLRPIYFCVPVTKTHGRRVYEIQNPGVHLAVYGIASKNYQLKATLANQFGRRDVVVVKSQFLAVPSEKLRWNEERE